MLLYSPAQAYKLVNFFIAATQALSPFLGLCHSLLFPQAAQCESSSSRIDVLKQELQRQKQCLLDGECVLYRVVVCVYSAAQ